MHDLQHVSLPSPADLLLRSYRQSDFLPTRLDLLARLKHQLIAHPTNAQSIYAEVLIEFLLYLTPEADAVQTRMLFHMVAVAVRTSYSQELFRWLIDELTQLMDSHPRKMSATFQFFLELIDTVEHELSSKKCAFERHFTSHFLNGVLALANLFLERSVVRLDDEFTIQRPIEDIVWILRLIHRAFTYDFGKESDQSDEFASERMPILLPTKYSRHSNYSEFQRWSKSAEWTQIYQFLYFATESIKLKEAVVEILGDMLRIHMKYFRSKVNYRTHVENISISLGNIVDSLVVQDSCISLVLKVGSNLNKLASPSTLSTFFDMSRQLQQGFIESVSRFITEQLIEQEVLNTSILRYFFNFLNSLCIRSSFELNCGVHEMLLASINSMGRQYESYIHTLVGKAFKTRQPRDVLLFREAIEQENIAEIELYFLPFRCYKPRNIAIESIQDLFLVICSKAERSMSLLELQKAEPWEKEACSSVINQCIQKIAEWYGFVRNAPSRKLVEEFAVIKELDEEQIDNEEQYIHLIRVVLLYLYSKIHSPHTFLGQRHLYVFHHLLALSFSFALDNISHVGNDNLIFEMVRLAQSISDPVSHEQKPMRRSSNSSDEDEVHYWDELTETMGRMKIEERPNQQMQGLVSIHVCLTSGDPLQIENIFTCEAYLQAITTNPKISLQTLLNRLGAAVLNYNKEDVSEQEMQSYVRSLVLLAPLSPQSREATLNRLYACLRAFLNSPNIFDPGLDQCLLHGCTCLISYNLQFLPSCLQFCLTADPNQFFELIAPLAGILLRNISAEDFVVLCLHLGAYVLIQLFPIFQSYLACHSNATADWSSLFLIFEEIQKQGYESSVINSIRSSVRQCEADERRNQTVTFQTQRQPQQTQVNASLVGMETGNEMQQPEQFNHGYNRQKTGLEMRKQIRVEWVDKSKFSSQVTEDEEELT